jgi:hypothetical protein
VAVDDRVHLLGCSLQLLRPDVQLAGLPWSVPLFKYGPFFLLLEHFCYTHFATGIKIKIKLFINQLHFVDD